MNPFRSVELWWVSNAAVWLFMFYLERPAVVKLVAGWLG